LQPALVRLEFRPRPVGFLHVRITADGLEMREIETG
jgi:hypothetical protein